MESVIHLMFFIFMNYYLMIGCIYGCVCTVCKCVFILTGSDNCIMCTVMSPTPISPWRQ